MRASLLAATIVAIVAITGAAKADKAAADACAASLDANGKAIYAAALPGVAGGGDLRATVRSAATSLVQSGAVPRSGAQAAGQAAGRCLMQL